MTCLLYSYAHPSTLSIANIETQTTVELIVYSWQLSNENLGKRHIHNTEIKCQQECF